MFERSIPEWLRHPPEAAARKPGAKAFATLSGIEAMIRGTLLSVFPLAMYQALGDAGAVSRVYFVIGLASLMLGLLLPWINRTVPRRWLYTFGAMMYLVGGTLGAMGGMMIVAALVACTLATVTCFICLNAYVLDYVSKNDLGKTETLRMFYSALSWSAGPVTGPDRVGSAAVSQMRKEPPVNCGGSVTSQRRSGLVAVTDPVFTWG